MKKREINIFLLNIILRPGTTFMKDQFAFLAEHACCSWKERWKRGGKRGGKKETKCTERNLTRYSKHSKQMERDDKREGEINRKGKLEIEPDIR